MTATGSKDTMNSIASIKSETPNIRNAIGFGLITFSAYAGMMFYQGIANLTLGTSPASEATANNCQFVTQLIMALSASFWSNKLSYGTRIIISMILYSISFIVTALMFSNIKQNKIPETCFLECWQRIVMGVSIALAAVAYSITTITVNQYVSFYDKSCVKGLISAEGIGAIVGLVFIRLEFIFGRFYTCIGLMVFPVIIGVSFFIILTTSDNVQTMSTKIKNSYEKSILIELYSIFVSFGQYSLPVFWIKLGYQLANNVVFGKIAKGQRYLFNNTHIAFRFGSLLGKLSVNLFYIQRYDILCDIGYIFIGIYIEMYIFGNEYILVDFISHDNYGHLISWILLTIPFGFCFGGVSSNVYCNIRNKIEHENTREWLLGCMRYVVIYGQLIGVTLSYLFIIFDLL